MGGVPASVRSIALRPNERGAEVIDRADNGMLCVDARRPPCDIHAMLAKLHMPDTRACVDVGEPAAALAAMLTRLVTVSVPSLTELGVAVVWKLVSPTRERRSTNAVADAPRRLGPSYHWSARQSMKAASSPTFVAPSFRYWNRTVCVPAPSHHDCDAHAVSPLMLFFFTPSIHSSR